MVMDDTDIFRFKVDEFFIDSTSEIALCVDHLIRKEEKEFIIAVSEKVLNAKTKESIEE